MKLELVGYGYGRILMFLNHDTPREAGEYVKKLINTGDSSLYGLDPEKILIRSPKIEYDYYDLDGNKINV